MGTTTEKLNYLNTTKKRLKAVLNGLGEDVTSETTFRNYVTALSNIYNRLPKTQFQEGTNINLGKTFKSKLDFDNDTNNYKKILIGNTVNSNDVTGEQSVVICGKNLYVGYNNMQSGFIPASGSYPTNNSSFPNARYFTIELKFGESITTSGSSTAGTGGRVRYIDKNTNEVVGSITGAISNEYITSTTSYAGRFADGTITANKDVIIAIMDLYTTENQFQIEYGTSATPYEPYIAPTTITINLGNIHLGSEDYIGYDISNDKWYTIINSTATEITDENLIDQLYDIWGSKCLEGTTIVNTSGTAPAKLRIRAIKGE